MTDVASTISPPPVNNSGNDEAVILEISSPSFIGISKLNTWPGLDILKKSPPSTAVTVILPPGLESSPVVTTVPPDKVKFSPGFKAKFPSSITIEPGLETSNL